MFRLILATGIVCAAASIRADVLYVANYNGGAVAGGSIVKLAADGTPTTFASGLTAPVGIAYDKNGNLYVAEQHAAAILKYTPDGTQSAFASIPGNFLGLSGLAFDTNGNLYVSVDGTTPGQNGGVDKITPAGVVNSFVTGLTSPEALAFDGANNLYIADNSENLVAKVTPTGQLTDYSSYINRPYGLAFNKAGELFVSSHTLGGSITKISADGTTAILLPSLNFPTGLAFDTIGNLYATEPGLSSTGNVMRMLSPDGNLSTFSNALMGGGYIADPSVSLPIPEPSSFVPAAVALVGFVYMRRRARR